MKNQTVALNQIYNVAPCTLESVAMTMPFDNPQPWKRPAVIVVPGGGYGHVSKREGQPIAVSFLARGFQSFILTYSTKFDGASYPTQLKQLACAVDYVRANADEFCVDANQVFVVGFSAGGHLVGNLAVQWQDMQGIYGAKLDCKPNAVALCYPVINKAVGHVGTYDAILAGYSEQQKQQLLNVLNIDQAVSNQTPPSFVWTTYADDAVPCQNSLLYAMACANNKVVCEMHMYPLGQHGLSTADQEVNSLNHSDVKRCAKWLDDCSAFFKLFC